MHRSLQHNKLPSSWSLSIGSRSSLPQDTKRFAQNSKSSSIVAEPGKGCSTERGQSISTDESKVFSTVLLDDILVPGIQDSVDTSFNTVLQVDHLMTTKGPGDSNISAGVEEPILTEASADDFKLKRTTPPDIVGKGREGVREPSAKPGAAVQCSTKVISTTPSSTPTPMSVIPGKVALNSTVRSSKAAANVGVGLSKGNQREPSRMTRANSSDSSKDVAQRTSTVKASVVVIKSKRVNTRPVIFQVDDTSKIEIPGTGTCAVSPGTVTNEPASEISTVESVREVEDTAAIVVDKLDSRENFVVSVPVQKAVSFPDSPVGDPLPVPSNTPSFSRSDVSAGIKGESFFGSTYQSDGIQNNVLNNQDAARDKPHSVSVVAEEQIKVAVRVRPLLKQERENNDKKTWDWDNKSIQLLEKDLNIFNPYTKTVKQSYQFDQIFGPEVANDYIFKSVVRNIVRSAMAGYHGSVFTYGQTSSGKTFTMNGDRTQEGIIALAVSECFDEVQRSPGRDFVLRVSYLEVYNEQIKDLLSLDPTPIRIQYDPKKGVVLSGVKELVVLNTVQVLALLKSGEAHRHIGSTDMNEKSSRAHTLFKIIIESTSSVGKEPVRVSALYLVDLAGSESAKLTNSKGERAREARFINQSLLTLSTIIQRLSEDKTHSFGGSGGNSVASDRKTQHLPYRDSKLTRILESALNGNAQIGIICTISPTLKCMDETSNTLKFASRAKMIKLTAKLNENIDDKTLLRAYKEEIELLRMRLKDLEAQSLLSAQHSIQRLVSNGESLGSSSSNSVDLLDSDRKDAYKKQNNMSEDFGRPGNNIHTYAEDDEEDADLMLQMISEMERLILRADVSKVQQSSRINDMMVHKDAATGSRQLLKHQGRSSTSKMKSKETVSDAKTSKRVSSSGAVRRGSGTGSVGTLNKSKRDVGNISPSALHLLNDVEVANNLSLTAVPSDRSLLKKVKYKPSKSVGINSDASAGSNISLTPIGGSVPDGSQLNASTKHVNFIAGSDAVDGEHCVAAGIPRPCYDMNDTAPRFKKHSRVGELTSSENSVGLGGDSPISHQDSSHKSIAALSIDDDNDEDGDVHPYNDDELSGLSRLNSYDDVEFGEGVDFESSFDESHIGVGRTQSIESHDVLDMEQDSIHGLSDIPNAEDSSVLFGVSKMLSVLKDHVAKTRSR
jgi:hypothetical protein